MRLTLLSKLCDVTKKEIESLSMSEYVGLVTNFLSQEEFKASLNVIMSIQVGEQTKGASNDMEM